MNKRIKAIASHINEGEKVSDIGCDQALLSIYLANKNISSIAIDVKENIIERCRVKINKLKLSNYIDLRVQNGVEGLLDGESDTLVLSGLGSFTILKILEKLSFKLNKIITVSNNNHKILREGMLKIGYKVLLEEIIFDKNKYYNLIVFIPGVTDYSTAELYIGVNHVNKSLLKSYNEVLLKKHKNVYEKSKNKHVKELIHVIENYKY